VRRVSVKCAALAVGGALMVGPALADAPGAATALRSDPKIAAAALIRLSDLPQGWRRDTRLASRRTGGTTCVAKWPRATATAKRGFAEPHRWLLSEALVFRSPFGARRFIASARPDRFRDCLAKDLMKRYHSTNGSGPLVVHAGPTAFGWYFGTDRSPAVFIHYTFARRGRAVVSLVQGAVVVPFAFRDASLLRLMLTRLR
jgi:hypothetical protein